MQALPKISIVVPSFNQASYLEETILSVLNQDYKNYELILIDGKSTDESIKIIQNYSSCFAYWVSEEDNGQTDALIKGFQKASGEIFYWLCSDDILLPGVLFKVAEIFKKNKDLDFLYGDTEYLYPDGTRILKPRISYHYETMLRAFNIVAQPSSFFTSKIYKKVGGLDPNLNYAMDYDLFLRFGENAEWIQLKESLSLYRIHEMSKTVNDKFRFEKEWLRCREKITNRSSNWIDKFYWYLYTIRVVWMFFYERGIIKIKYDRRKYFPLDV